MLIPQAIAPYNEESCRETNNVLLTSAPPDVKEMAIADGVKVCVKKKYKFSTKVNNSSFADESLGPFNHSATELT